MFCFSDRLLVFFADFSEEFAVPRLLDPNENGKYLGPRTHRSGSGLSVM